MRGGSSHLQRIAIVVFGITGLMLNIWIAWNLFLRGAGTGRNDFTSFYGGAALAGTPDLYNPTKVSELQLRVTGERTSEAEKFVRLPCYAIFLKPLAWLPYPAAYLIWELLSAAALLAALLLWPGQSATTKWLTFCWMLPIFVALFNGQDDALVLFWIALAANLLHRERPLTAGMALAMAASKYHLLVLIPLVIVAQRRWRMAAGTAMAGGALIAVSFLSAGLDWPWRYFALLADSRLIPNSHIMPSLWANFKNMRFGLEFEMLAAIVLAAVIYRVARLDRSFERPLGLALVGGILLSLHCWLADCTLVLPAIMISVHRAARYARFPTFAQLTPVPWFLVHLPPPLPVAARVLLVLLVLAGLLDSELSSGSRRFLSTRSTRFPAKGITMVKMAAHHISQMGAAASSRGAKRSARNQPAVMAAPNASAVKRCSARVVAAWTASA